MKKQSKQRISFRNLVLVATFCISSLASVAQQYTIKIQDSDTKLAVPNAQIEVKNLSTHTHKFYVSDADGILKLDDKLPIIITVKSLAYQSFQDTISSIYNNIYLVDLQEDMFHLGEMVVTATRTSKPLKDVPVITHIVTAQEIENKGIDNVQTLLETSLPGIEFQRHGTSQDIDVQGLGGRNILILVDGERMAGETRGNIDYDRINTADIEKVEIIKGASSALYGSQAMGAVVNIITKQSKQKFYAELTYEQKTRAEKNFDNLEKDDEHYELKRNLDRQNNEYNLLFGFNFKSLKSKTILNWKNTDGYTLFDTDSLQKHYINYDTVIYNNKVVQPTGIEGGRKLSATQKLSYSITDYLSAEANVQYYNRHKYDFYQVDKKHDYFDDMGYGLKLIYNNKENTTIELSFASDIYNKYDYKERLQRADLNYKDKFINPKLITSYTFNKHQFLLGTEFLRETLLTDMFVYGELIDKTSSTFTVFMQDDFKMNEQLNIVAGFRAQYNTAFRFQFSPKLSLMYSLNSWRIRANYAMGYRAPGLKELFMNWNHLDMFMIEGNANLRPEINHYTSLSTEFTNSIFNASVAVFSNSFKDKIAGEWAENQTIYRYANIDKSLLFGGDAFVKAKLSNFLVSAAYSYVNESKRNDAVRLSALSPHTANAQIAYVFNKPNYRLNVNFGTRFIGAKHFHVKDEFVAGADTITDYYSVDYKAYMICRLSVRQQFFNKFSIVAGIDNIFNYKAPMVTFNSYVGTGRLFYIRMKLKFNKQK